MKIGVVLIFVMSVAVRSDPVTSETSFTDFLEGFLSTINAKKEFNNVIACLRDANEILAKLAEVWNLLLKFTFDDFMKAIVLLWKSLQDLFFYLADCVKGAQELQKIKDAINNLKLFNVIMKILHNAQDIRSYITEMTISIRTSDILEAGRVLGQVTHTILFKSDKTVFGVGSSGVFDFLEGFLIGLGNGNLFDKSVSCVRSTGIIIEDIKELIANLNDIKRIFELFIKVGKEFIITVKDCITATFDITFLISKLISLDSSKIFKRFVLHQVAIVKDIVGFFDYLGRWQLKEAGKLLGDIPYLLIIKDD